ncbi:ATP-binding protein [Roseateles saccharophilus]|uniref:C4-dicarboxylate transport sensor protein DctB n=1 Tax=Roseateles saccharophilus TaxID=304 RepID=A0A4R3UNC0_ROSSA|nr:ATP-binding protein [Roseateles saccharophilus]MDG0833590.1 sensor histidine kinase [Roseateles saccharophilus]TCU92161.1 two-component system C4-dicarboxylate transport sensor histidine kinase DctB [Roseateles saccharophilus]
MRKLLRTDRLRPSRWQRSLTLLLLALLGGTAVAYAAWRLSLDLALAQTQGDAQRHLRFVAHELTGTLDKYEALPQVLARHPALAGLLAEPASRARAAEVDALLEGVARDAAAAAIFLIDARGLTLASSNWREPQTFVGQNYAYRPYFRDAMASGGGHFYARGSTTGTPGYFIAHRLAGPDAGVVVLKVSLDEMEANWARSAAELMLADARGVVFLASRPEWKYRTLQPLITAVRTELHDTQQYGDLPLQPLQRESSGAMGELRVERIATASARLRALVTEQAVEGRGWTLLSFTEIRGAEQIAAGRAWAAALGWVSLLLLLAYLQLRRRRASERAAAQGELRAAYDSLEERIAARTQELQARVDELHRTERTLRATQDELVQAGKLAVLGQMAASITHEINQPLAALRALNDNARVFLERGMQADAEGNLEAIDGLTQRIAAIVAQLKGFARRDELRVQPVPVAAAFQSAVALVSAEARRQRVRLDCPAVPEGLAVLGQQVRVEQVLVNLLRNGIDASAEKGSGTVTLQAEVDGGQALLRVTDDGPGLGDEVLARLFEPFFTTKRRGDGLGLGLSISASIANALGGSLQGGNREQGGAWFTLRLPLA